METGREDKEQLAALLYHRDRFIPWNNGCFAYGSVEI